MRRRRTAAALVLSATLLGALVGVTYAYFSDSTSTSGNSFTAGWMRLEDNDSDSRLVQLSSASPGDASTGCIRVNYEGNVPSDLRIYGTVTGTIAPYVTAKITRGTDSSPSFKSCTNFTADATNYIGQGAGVMYSGTLSSLPSSWGSGIVDAPGAAETWTGGEARSYKVTLTMGSNTAGQATSGSAQFIFEARNQ